MTETVTHVAMRRISQGSNTNRYYPLNGIVVSTNNNSQLIIDAQEIGVRGLVTNDIANVFEDGSFIINGRIDNVIVSGGVKLFPELIERKIRKFIPGCFFIGSIPDEKLGEKLMLFIEGKKIDKNKTELILNELKKNLQKFEVPKEIVFLPDFLRTETGKIVRKKSVCNFLDKKNKE
jgi:O-succinylbenzoic acid--CoA ligase